MAQASGPIVVGVSTHQSGRDALALLHETGVRHIRNDLWWADVEKKRGQYRIPAYFAAFFNRARAEDLRPLVILCYGNPLYDRGARPTTPASREAFVRYAEFCVRTYRGRVKYWEIWNEWNWSTGMARDSRGTAADYVALVKEVYPRLKKIDPDAIFLAGGIAGEDLAWLNAACRKGLLRYCDGISIHPYCWGAPGDQRLPEIGAVARINRYRAALRSFQAEPPVPLYLTEMGWPTHRPASGRAISPEESAAWLARLYLLSPTLAGVKGIWWYDLQDDGLAPANPEHHFGLLRHDLTPKPSYYALRDVAPFLQRVRAAAEVPTHFSGLKLVQYTLENERTAYAAWSVHANESWQITFSAPRERNGSKLRLTTIGSGTVESRWSGDARSREARLSVSTGAMPLVLEGNFHSAFVHEIRPLH